MKASRKSQNLVIPVNFEKQPKEPLPLTAFLFSRRGELLQQVKVDKDKATFQDVPETNMNELRVFIAATPKERSVEVGAIADMERLHAFEPVLDVDAKGGLKILPIPEYLSKWWCFAFCRVRGRVSKNFMIDGHYENRPICNARVHICEIDKIWWLLPRIPDDILVRIPDFILHPELPIPIPHPFPDPPPFERIPGLGPLFEAKSFPKTTSAALTFRGGEMSGKQNIREEAASERTLASIRKAAANIQPDIKEQLLSGNTIQIRKVIAENFQLFHPIFCWLPWIWPYFYHCDEIKTVHTDQNGNFDTNIFYWGCGDHPDLYFWVEYYIDGVWTTVYKPYIPCHTYWNFDCGSKVAIHITDPRVLWGCNTVLDGDIIWIKTIGHGANIKHIRQTNLPSAIQNVPFNRIGLSDLALAIGDFRRPFGNYLYFLIQFGSGLPSNGMKYYRWSCRKKRNADLSPASGPLTILNNELFKSYTFEFFDALMHKHFDQKSFRLGPVSHGGTDNLFLIPPASPTQAPVNAPNTEHPNWDQNTASVRFDSAQLDDGLYEFKLEIFDSSGNKVPHLPRQLFQTPGYSSFTPSIDATDEYLVLSDPTHADAFRMNVRIDNQHCEADIYKILVDGVETTPNCCGFVKYLPSSDIEIRFRAYHPHNFGDFNFVVKKGTCNDPVQTAATNTSGMVIGSTYNGAIENYHRNVASIYSKTFSPATLLGICGGDGKAAFAEHLHIDGLATNGNVVLNTFDAGALAAFALEPE